MSSLVYAVFSFTVEEQSLKAVTMSLQLLYTKQTNDEDDRQIGEIN